MDIISLTKNIPPTLNSAIANTIILLTEKLISLLSKRYNIEQKELDNVVGEFDENLKFEVILLRQKIERKRKADLRKEEKQKEIDARPKCNYEFGKRSKRYGETCGKPSCLDGLDNDIYKCSPHYRQYLKKINKEENTSKEERVEEKTIENTNEEIDTEKLIIHDKHDDQLHFMKIEIQDGDTSRKYAVDKNSGMIVSIPSSEKLKKISTNPELVKLEGEWDNETQDINRDTSERIIMLAKKYSFNL